jgi:tetratricopeptide (TPR) repeat protein
MKTESTVYAIAGVIFGLIAGWMIGTQQAAQRVPTAAPAAASAPAAANEQGSRAAVLDETQVNALKTVAEREPKNAQSRVQLGNLYFDAERYDDAIKWYTEAVALLPNDVNVSTDLGVCLYYTNQPDKALAQFDHSLKIDPNHAKTLLNVGIVRAFGKQDLGGATEVWQKVIKLAPDSPEGQAAKRALDTLQSAHPGVGGAAQNALLEFVFVLLAARAFWRLVGGIVQGIAGTPRDVAPPSRGVAMVRDPVCGTFVLPDRAVTLAAGGQRLYFCSAACRDAYRASGRTAGSGTVQGRTA